MRPGRRAAPRLGIVFAGGVVTIRLYVTPNQTCPWFSALESLLRHDSFELHQGRRFVRGRRATGRTLRLAGSIGHAGRHAGHEQEDLGDKAPARVEGAVSALYVR